MADIWQLSISYRDCAFEATLNGLPIASGDTAEDGFSSAPLNALLAGPDNELRVVVTRRGPDAAWSGRIESLQSGDIIDSADPGDLELPAGEAPVELVHRFACEVDQLSALLAEAQPAEADAIRSFAGELRAALDQADPAQALALFRPKFDALAAAFGHPRELIEQQAPQMLAAFRGRCRFAPADVQPRACCDGRLWQLLDADGQHLLRFEDGDGGVMTLEAIAAVLPEGPRVVR